MYNWSTNTSKLSQNSEKFAIWKLEQLINYGLNGEKLDARLLKKYWNKLQIDPENRKFLHLLLWPKKKDNKSYSLRSN